MSRFIRLYEKKRGQRRTGSKALGNIGEAFFFGTFFMVGCVAFGWMFALFVWPEWRANRQFAPAQCVIVDAQVDNKPATQNEPAQYRPDIQIRYRVDERDYEESAYDVTRIYSPDKQAVEAMVAQFEKNQEYPCWYDPIDPHRAVLVRGYSGWLYLTLLIPLSFITICGGALVYTLLHWNSSNERRALMVQRAAQIDLFEVDATDSNFPTVPGVGNQTNSPGTSLAYRLPITTATGWRIFAITATCVIWNGIVIAFIVMALGGILRGQPDWVLVALITPFAVAGVTLVVYLAKQVMIATGVGPTRIEISHHPLNPGGQYELFLSQAGRLTMRSLAVWLACDEQASFRQGTDTRTEMRRVFEERCFLREEFEIQQGLPFESRCELRVPDSAMHSFQTQHNEVCWKLIVKGVVAGWPDYEREFQIVVNPFSGRKHA